LKRISLKREKNKASLTGMQIANVRYALEALAKDWSCHRISSNSANALILPKLQLGVMVRAHYSGTVSTVCQYANESERQCNFGGELIGSKLVNR